MMNRRDFVGVALISTAGALLTACAREPEPPSIRSVIDSNAAFSTLARLLAESGVQSLDGGGPFTVFAPRNSAFAALPEGEIDRLLLPANRAELTRLLQLHVVAGSYTAADLVNRTTTLRTESGLDIIVDGFDGIDVGGIPIVQPDIIANNGVVHVIGGIIRPPA